METRCVTLIDLRFRKEKSFAYHYANVLKYVLLDLEGNQKRGRFITYSERMSLKTNPRLNGEKTEFLSN